MQRGLDDPWTENCQVYLLLWAPLRFHLFDLLLHHSTTHSDALQCAFFHQSLIVNSLPNTLQMMVVFSFFFQWIYSTYAKRESLTGVGALSLTDTDHKGVPQVGSKISTESQHDPKRSAQSMTAYSYFFLQKKPPFPFSVLWVHSSLTPDVQGGYHLEALPIRVFPHPAWISRQNVSLAVVLERRALNFEFSYTFPLNGTGRQRRRERERMDRSKARETDSVEGWGLGPRGREQRRE